MRLTVLGAGPAYTDRPEAAGASYLVTSDSTNVLLDLGHGSFARIFGAVAPEDLDAIAISHLHPDHFVDLVPFRHYLRYYLHPPRRMRVLGPGDLAARLDALHAEPGFASQALDIEPIGSSAHAIGPLVLESRKVAHTDDSYAMRVSPGAGRPRARGSSTAGTAVAPTISVRSSRPATRCSPRSRSVRDPCQPG